MRHTLDFLKEMDSHCMKFCRELLLKKLTDTQKEELRKIEAENKISFRHGARGSYVDPVASHKRRVRTNKNFWKSKRKKK